MKTNECLSRVALETCLFFEFCEEETVTLDVAVEQLEQITAQLAELDDEGKQTLAKVCTEMAAEYGDEPRKAQFLSDFMTSFAIAAPTA